jgi:hypothetical protein
MEAFWSDSLLTDILSKPHLPLEHTFCAHSKRFKLGLDSSTSLRKTAKSPKVR